MGKTIIQTIGPLYGEPINGTVFGRPNGSVYVPSVNTINATLPTEYIVIQLFASRKYIISSKADGQRGGTVSMVAESQDTANNMAWEFADNPDFTDSVIRNYSAGIFNMTDSSIVIVPDDYELVADATYYLRAVLISSSGVPVAYSSVMQVKGVVTE